MSLISDVIKSTTAIFKGMSRTLSEIPREKWTVQRLKAVSEHYGFSLDTPWKDLPEKYKNIVLYGSGTDVIKMTHESEAGNFSYEKPFEGIITNLERRFAETTSEGTKREISQCNPDMRRKEN